MYTFEMHIYKLYIYIYIYIYICIYIYIYINYIYVTIYFGFLTKKTIIGHYTVFHGLIPIFRRLQFVRLNKSYYDSVTDLRKIR